jgi:hypothetical protein
MCDVQVSLAFRGGYFPDKSDTTNAEISDQDSI